MYVLFIIYDEILDTYHTTQTSQSQHTTHKL